jgi:cell division protein FtsI (penicillin-binding protein 3)
MTPAALPLDNRWKALSDALKMPLDQLASRINANPKGVLSIWRVRLTDMGDYIKN